MLIHAHECVFSIATSVGQAGMRETSASGNLVHNAHIKYVATFLNNCDVGGYLTGVVDPFSNDLGSSSQDGRKGERDSMDPDIKTILSGPGITGINVGYQTVGNYNIYLEWEGGFQAIDFRIVEATAGYFEFYQSQFLAGTVTTVTTAPTQVEALRLGVQSIMVGYNSAIARGGKARRQLVSKEL
jgi:hypothetical protein